ncbi:hypothetical protein BH20CHL1_BH20CHL1_08830 [soil metagenome]
MVLMLITCTRGLPEPQQTDDPFERTWERTDRPVASGDVSRTWMWGPEAFTEAVIEPYLDAPGGERREQYYDKSRMELNNSDGEADSLWNVTNGLLVVEMMSGNVQLGDNTFEHRGPTFVYAAGDQVDDPESPTYLTIAQLQGRPQHPAGEPIIATVNRNAGIDTNPDLAQYDVRPAAVVEETDHAVASVFWDFMNSQGEIYDDGDLTTGKIFENPFYATGYPRTEAYGAHIQLDGVKTWVLLQCFERRCLTFTPDNPDGWQVEAGNVGQHYYEWRYEAAGLPQVTVTTTAREVPLVVQVADTSDLRRCGLMHRFSMPENQGMLFVHTSDQNSGFWNRNTEIPLQLAWISADGTILELTDMAAADRSSPDYPISYIPSVSYRYVIEANAGWFTNNGVEVGDLIDLSEALARGSSDTASLCETMGY